MKTIYICFLFCASCGSSTAAVATDAGPGLDAATDTAPEPPQCSADVSGIRLTSSDPYAYPPYALDRCTLAYIAEDNALHLRDLATGKDEIIDSDSPRRPTLAGDTLAWESIVGGSSVVRVRQGGTVTTLDGIAGEPRAAVDAVSFTKWLSADPKGDTDVMLYVPSKRATTLVAGGPGQQRFSDASEGYIAVTDFSEDPDGRFDNDEKDLADIMILDRHTGALTSRKKPGKQAFPILAGGTTLVFHDWAAIHPQPKLEAYDLLRTTVDAPVSADLKLASIETYPPYTRPAGRGGVIEWVVRNSSGVTLWRATAGGAPSKDALAAADMFAPATDITRTAIGVRVDGSGAPVLRIVGR